MQTFACPIVRWTDVSATLCQVWLHAPGYPYQAGQYLQIKLPGNLYPAFSIANAPNPEEHIELHIRHTPENRVASELVQWITSQQAIEITPAKGHCTAKLRQGRPTLMLAAGTGFAPMKALIEQAILDNEQVPLQLYWGVACVGDFYLQDFIQTWLKIQPESAYTPIIGFGLPDQVCLDYPSLNDYRIFCAGPQAFVTACFKQLTAFGLQRENFFTDMEID